MAIGGALAVVGEAFALARKAGVDAAKVREALLGGFAASRVLEVHGERILTKNYKPGFRANLYNKDRGIVLETAHAHDVPMPVTTVIAQLVNSMMAKGEGDLDYSALATVLFDLAGNPEFAQALLRKVTDLMKASVIGLLQEAGDYIDVLITGDDLGSQNAPLMSPRMYRRMVKPFQAEIYAQIKRRTGAKVFYHSDGNVYPLLGDLIEMGVDLLNPAQVSARDMGDTARLKREFGADLTFWEVAATPRRCFRSALRKRCATTCAAAWRSSCRAAGLSGIPSTTSWPTSLRKI
jgi:hypothetical protein